MVEVTGKVIKKQDGFSLVELMIVMVLLGLVISLGFTYYDFGVKAFERGEERTIAQNAARLTSDFITTQLRFAREIEINPEGDYSVSTAFDDYQYIYLDQNGSINYREAGGNERIIANSQADYIT